MKKRWILRGGAGILLMALLAFLVGEAVLLLWNALIPDIFHGPTISYWQAVGLLVLAHLLAGGPGRMMNFGRWRKERWREHFEKRLTSMTPEEREKFRAEWDHRCWPHHDRAETAKPANS
jgi:hypothetical protein